jgi:fucose 4-O-acetylase-like acetyltransferase
MLNTQRNTTADFIKGILILLVFIGHWLQGNMNETLSRTFIYFFHMPMFFFVSGLLLGYEKIEKEPIRYLIKKCLTLGIPWFIASLLYLLAINHNRLLSINAKDILRIFYIPYFHLWYIEAYLGYLTLFWCLTKLNKFAIKIKTDYYMAIITALSFFIGIFARLKSEEQTVFGHLINYVFRLQNLPFFMFGITLSGKTKSVSNTFYYFALMSLCLIPLSFYKDLGHITETVIFIAVNIILAINIYKLINEKKIYVKVINEIGTKTLWIYLLHVFSLLAAQYLAGQADLKQWYLTSLICMTSLIGLLFFLEAILKKRFF